MAVDDSPTQLAHLAHVLEEAGFQVSTARDGRTALDQARRFMPDVIVSDIVMPGMDGYALCLAVRGDREMGGVPVILATLLTSPADVMQGIESGANGFVTKPYDDSFLVDQVKRALENRASVSGPSSEPGLGIRRDGHTYENTDPGRTLELLLSTYANAVHQNEELQRARSGLRAANDELEDRIRERTVDLEAQVALRRGTEEELRAALARMKGFMDANVVGVFFSRPDGVVVDANDYFLDLIGRTRGELERSELNMLALMPPERRPTPNDAIDEMKGAAPSAPYEREYLRADGTGVPVLVAAASLASPDKLVAALVLDDTERKRVELEMLRLSTAIEQSPDAVLITDVDGSIEYVNPAFVDLSGYTREEALGRNPRFLKSGVQGVAFYAAMWSTLKSGHCFAGEFTNRRKDGSLFQEEAVISPVRDAEGTTRSFVAIKRNVTRERATAATLSRLAHERALVAASLAELAVGSSASGTAELMCRQVARLSGVASASLSYFTARGPAMPLAFVRADGVPAPLRMQPLRRSQRLREQAALGPWVEAWVRRPWHTYDRMFHEMGVRSAAIAPIRWGGNLLGLLTITSAGSSATSELTELLPALVEFAGVAGPLMGPAIVDLTTAGHVRERTLKAIGDGAFHPVYQPIVDIETGEPVGYEALTRFDSGQRPDLCFADAWSVDMGLALEMATLGAAVAGARRLPHGSWLSLNLSPRLLQDPGRLSAVLWPSDRPIVLEITEHEIIEDYRTVHAALRALGHDVRVAVDDAGSGIANFDHIVELRPDLVKLDIGLVRGVNADLGRQAMVVAMSHFALKSGCLLLAEGVETQAEADTLRGLGVDLGQGYLFGRPEPAEKWMAAEVGQ
jgi:PAS domain S-box-containing protein